MWMNCIILMRLYEPAPSIWFEWWFDNIKPSDQNITDEDILKNIP